MIAVQTSRKRDEESRKEKDNREVRPTAHLVVEEEGAGRGKELRTRRNRENRRVTRWMEMKGDISGREKFVG